MKFQCRVAAAVVEEGRALVSREIHDDIWALAGGKVESRETAQEAFRREMREELGVEIEAGPLLWVVDNFFRYRGTEFHELGLYFRAKLPASVPRDRAWKIAEERTTLIFEWRDLDELAALPLKPAFLAEALREPPDRATYLVVRD